jgi:hypothetical protein
MGKILSERLAGPDDPIYREPLRGYTPHWTRRAGTAPAIAVSYRSVDGCLDDEGPAARQPHRDGDGNGDPAAADNVPSPRAASARKDSTR